MSNSCTGAALVVGFGPQAVEDRLRGAGFGSIEGVEAIAQAYARLSGCTLLLMEVARGQVDESVALVRHAQASRRPPLIILGGRHVPARVVAELTWTAGGAYVETCTAPDELMARLDELRDPVVLCKRMARALVGRVPMKDALWYLRGLMSREALGRTDGNRGHAARILGVDRRHVARVAEEFRDHRFAPNWR